MRKEYEPLFTPFKIGNVEIKNRFVMCPMTGTSPIMKNKFNQSIVEFYKRRAKNGVGLIITAPCMVLDMWGRGYWLSDAEDTFKGPFKNFVSEIHECGSKIFMQLGVGLGRVVHTNPEVPIPGAEIKNILTAASELPNVWDPQIIHRALTREEIIELRDNTIKSAVLAKESGVDGVEIHAVHEGYLLDQFAISFFNHRNDEYGGTLENRMRLACEIVKGIREACGEDFGISMRFGIVSKIKDFNSGALPGENYIEKGRTKEESIAAANMLIQAGCNAFNADNGSYDSWYWAHPPVYMAPACNLSDAEFLKSNIEATVICAGRMENHLKTAAAIKENRIDAVGIARQFLADYELVSKLERGKESGIRPCIACHNGCLGSLLNGKGLSCALDPSVMHEAEYTIEPAKKSLEVAVVGGGISGMETARLCAIKGHKVTVYEKNSCLAGVFNAAAAPFFKEADKSLIEWYERQMEKLGIIVKLNTEVTEEIIKTGGFDAVVIATGSTPRILDFKSMDSNNLISAIDYLLGKKTLGKNVVVIGGGLTGCEIAYDAASKGHNVTVVEIMPEILANKGLCAANTTMLKDLLKYYDVDVYTSARIEEITDTIARISVESSTFEIKADSIVVSAGYDSRNAFPDLIGEGLKVYVAGDAMKVGNLMTCIQDAYRIAKEL